MEWYIFFGISFIIAAVSIPFSEWKRLWPAGIISVLVLASIELTFTRLNAYSFVPSNINISQVPVPYLLSGFWGGALLVHFYPQKKLYRLPYVLFASLIFLILEIIVVRFRYLQYHNWNMFNSYILNVYGFIIVLWLFDELRQYFTIKE